MRVHGLNQANLFAAAPAFDLFLAINRSIWIGERLVIDKAREIVAPGKSRNQFVPPLLLNGVIPKSGVVQPGEGSCAGLA